MTKWEYIITPTPPRYEDRIERLKERGEEGWELAAVYDRLMYFKRPAARTYMKPPIKND